MELGLNFWLELAVLLACLFYAAPKGGMTLGLMGGIGLIIFVFGFGLKPGKPPVDVILTIMAVVCASSALQAAGGLDCLLQIAERVLRNHPRAVCYLAPYLCWMLTVLCGTGHTVYTMLPIIYDVAIKNGIQRLRPVFDAWMLEGGLHYPEGRETSFYGFFSGHASNSFGLIASLLVGFSNDRSHNYSGFALFGYLWAALVSVSRVMIGRHYLGDILVGTLFGLFVGYSVGLLTKYLINKYLPASREEA